MKKQINFNLNSNNSPNKQVILLLYIMLKRKIRNKHKWNNFKQGQKHTHNQSYNQRNKLNNNKKYVVLTRNIKSELKNLLTFQRLINNKTPNLNMTAFHTEKFTGCKLYFKDSSNKYRFLKPSVKKTLDL